MNLRQWQRLAGMMLTGAIVAAAVGSVAAERFALVSAQVVTSTDRPSVLKILANGPVAFRVVPEEELGVPGGERLVLDLYGVDAGALSGTQWLDEFVLTVQAGADQVTRISVAGPPHHRLGALTARLGTASHVLEICACGEP